MVSSGEYCDKDLLLHYYLHSVIDTSGRLDIFLRFNEEESKPYFRDILRSKSQASLFSIIFSSLPVIIYKLSYSTVKYS